MENTTVSFIVGAFVSADDVEEFVFSDGSITAAVREENGGGAHAEKTVREEHSTFFAGVVVGSDDFSGENKSKRVRMDLKDVSSEVDGDEAGAAAHAGEIEAADVGAEVVVIDDYGGE